MEFRRIVYFLKVAQCSSFSQAARELFISPQALSRQIRELEEELGYRLFIRNTVKVALTDQGQAMYDRFAPLNEAWERAWLESIKKTNIRLGFFAGISESEWLDRLLEHLTRDYKEWNLELHAMDLPQIVEGILSGTLDLALTAMYEGERYNGCCVKSLYAALARVYMPSSHSLADHESISLQDILESSCILVDNEKEQPGSIFDLVRKKGHPVFVKDNLSLAQTIQIHRAIALVPETGELDKRQGIISRPLDEDCDFSFQVCLIYKEGHPLSHSFEGIASRFISS